MKRMLIPMIALTGLFVSCKKSSSGPSGGISATVNGSAKNFSTGALALKTSNGGLTQIIIGGDANVNTGEALALELDNSLGGGVDSLVAGTYSDTSTRFSVNIVYTVSTTSQDDYEGGSLIDGALLGGTPITNHVAIKISSITSTTIAGSYSGNLYLNGDTSGTPWAITGTFNVALHQ